jgi:hypothetical protein
MARTHIFLPFLSVVFVCLAVAADEPRLTLSEVRHAADAEARQHADLEVYTRVEPSYDPATKTWGVNYRLKSSSPQPTGQGILSVSIDDTTGFTRTRFWLATPTPAPPPPPPRFGTRFILDMVVLAAAVALLIWSFLRRRLKHEVTS